MRPEPRVPTPWEFQRTRESRWGCIAAYLTILLVWTSAVVLGYALAAVLPSVEAIGAAWIGGILVGLNAPWYWRRIRRATR